MIIRGEIINYNEERKTADVKLLIEINPLIELKDIKDLRQGLGGGALLNQPLKKGDIVGLTSISTPNDIEEKSSAHLMSTSQSYVITQVIKTKKSKEAKITYEDGSNKISFSGEGKSIIKIGQVDLLEIVKSIAELAEGIASIFPEITFTVITQGGKAFGDTDLIPIRIKAEKYAKEAKKIQTDLEGIKGNE